MDPRRILVPVSYGPSSEQAFKEAAVLASTTGARLIVVNVKRMPKKLFHSAGGLKFDDVVQQVREERKERLDDFVKKGLRDLGLSVAVEEVNLEEDDPIKAILNFAKEYEVDLMVLGHHDETKLEHFFFGSNIHKLVDGAPCDVVVTRMRLHKLAEKTEEAA